jgi:hypothetical protein
MWYGQKYEIEWQREIMIIPLFVIWIPRSAGIFLKFHELVPHFHQNYVTLKYVVCIVYYFIMAEYTLLYNFIITVDINTHPNASTNSSSINRCKEWKRKVLPNVEIFQHNWTFSNFFHPNWNFLLWIAAGTFMWRDTNSRQ